MESGNVNWKRGILRLQIVLTVAVLIVAVIAYQEVSHSDEELVVMTTIAIIAAIWAGPYAVQWVRAGFKR